MVGAISVQGVSKVFCADGRTQVHALDNVNIDIAPGSFVSFIGASGCGKSTLLRIIAGLTAPGAGDVFMDGEKIKGANPERGFAFQDHTLFPWLTIAQNIAFGVRANKKSEVARWIELAGLSGFEKSFPHELSGGMCQRASLARALAARPKVLMLDEPLGALDAFTRMNMQDEILRIWQRRKTTMLMVTHDVDEAVYMSDKVVVMTPRPGRISEIIPITMSRPRARSGEEFTLVRSKILDLLHFGGEKRTPDYYL